MSHEEAESTGAVAVADPEGPEPAGEESRAGTKGRAKSEPAAGEQQKLPARAVAKIVVAVLIVVAVVGVVAGLAWKVSSVTAERDAADAAVSSASKAEKVSLDYATGAAQMSFQDQDGWIARLTKGTGPDLSKRLHDAATSMQSIIVPLQWTSTAEPIVAKIKSESNGVYQVYCFVNVSTKTTQAPEGIESTATYTVSVDSNDDWKITDVGGVGAALAVPGQPK